MSTVPYASCLRSEPLPVFRRRRERQVLEPCASLADPSPWTLLEPWTQAVSRKPQRAAAVSTLVSNRDITQEHPPSPTDGPICPKRLFWMTLGYAGCRFARTENPLVGNSIPPLPTIRISSDLNDVLRSGGLDVGIETEVADCVPSVLGAAGIPQCRAAVRQCAQRPAALRDDYPR